MLGCMTNRNRLAIALALISLLLLWPGLNQPALTIRATMDLFGVTRQLTNETRSVIGAIQSLRASGNFFVAALIILFSVLIPLIKATLLIPIFVMGASQQRYRLFVFVLAPLYGLLHLVVLMPVRLYALATLNRARWGTRSTVEVHLS